MIDDLTSAKLKATSTKEERDLCFARFYERFPTEAEREEVIYRAASPSGIRCECGNLVTNRKYGERTAICPRCKKEASATANTIFHGTKRLTAYCCAIFVIGEGLAISANDFSKRNGIATSSGNIILHEISAVVVEQFGDAAEMISAILCKPVAKRSKETPAREHPKAEQIEAEKRAAKSAGIKRASGANPRAVPEVARPANKVPDSDMEKTVLEFLSIQPLQFEDLARQASLPQTELMCALTMLELGGFVKPLPGNCFAAIENDIPLSFQQPRSPLEPRKAKHFFLFVRKTFHAISRKYLQRYLARYWCFVDRERWNFESLLEVCAKAPKKSYAQLTSYLTPLSVKVVFPEAC